MDIASNALKDIASINMGNAK